MSPTAPAHFVADFTKLCTALEAGNYVFNIEGDLYLKAEAPESLVRPYKGLLNMGYANGWIV